MKECLEPDSVWGLFNVKSEAEYIDRYLIEGRFHERVPQDVLKNYETIEYLMRFAWYNYGIYESAVTKLLMTLEMAVKIRAKEKEIPSYTIDKKQRKWDKNLQTLISEVTGLENDDERLQILNNLRFIRNKLAHPDSHSAIGVLVRNKIVPTINAINELFEEEEQQAHDHLTVQNQIMALNGQCLVLELEDKKLLVSGVELLESFNSKTPSYLLFIEPLIEHSKDYFSKDLYPTFIALSLSSILFAEGVLFAKDRNDNPIKLYVCNKELNVRRFKEFLANKQSASKTVKFTYEHGLQSFRFEQKELFKYNFYWN